uniref:Uncharacterized protein n=1 Tax=Solanum lycopersicum TaxID=4081 RepID=A0A3Q7IUZ3_SOLLC
FLVKVSWLKML